MTFFKFELYSAAVKTIPPQLTERIDFMFTLLFVMILLLSLGLLLLYLKYLSLRG